MKNLLEEKRNLIESLKNYQIALNNASQFGDDKFTNPIITAIDMTRAKLEEINNKIEEAEKEEAKEIKSSDLTLNQYMKVVEVEKITKENMSDLLDFSIKDIRPMGLFKMMKNKGPKGERIIRKAGSNLYPMTLNKISNLEDREEARQILIEILKYLPVFNYLEITNRIVIHLEGGVVFSDYGGLSIYGVEMVDEELSYYGDSSKESNRKNKIVSDLIYEVDKILKKYIR